MTELNHKALYRDALLLVNQASGEDYKLGGGDDPRVVEASQRILRKYEEALDSLNRSIAIGTGCQSSESRVMVERAKKMSLQVNERCAELRELCKQKKANKAKPRASPTTARRTKRAEAYDVPRDDPVGSPSPGRRRTVTKKTAKKSSRIEAFYSDDDDDDYVEAEDDGDLHIARRRTKGTAAKSKTDGKKTTSGAGRGRKRKAVDSDDAFIVVDDDSSDGDKRQIKARKNKSNDSDDDYIVVPVRSRRKKSTVSADDSADDYTSSPKKRASTSTAKTKRTTRSSKRADDAEVVPKRTTKRSVAKSDESQVNRSYDLLPSAPQPVPVLPPLPPLTDIQSSRASKPFEVPALPPDFRPRSLGPKKGSKEDKERREQLLRSVDKNLIEAILNEVVVSGPNVHWSDIGGLDNVKQALYEAIILPCSCPELFSGLRKASRGLLMFGPPGNGKTMIAKAVATESHTNFFSISASSLVSKWLGQSEKMVKALFAVARYLQPSVVFIDEVDSLLSKRKEDENEALRRLKTEFLVQLDGVGSGDGTELVFVMGATNRPQDLDEAALRRFTKRIYVPLPDEKTRFVILKNLLSKNATTITAPQMHKLAQLTVNYSAADLTHLCEEAAMYPLRDLSPGRIAAIATRRAASSVRPISYDDIVRAMSAIRASVAPRTLRELEEWDRSYGSR